MKPNYFLKEAPFVRLIIPVIFGISLSFYVQWFQSLLVVILSLLIIPTVIWYFLKSKIKYAYSAYFGTIILLQLLLLSYIIAHFSFNKNQCDYVTNQSAISTCLQIKSQPNLKGKYYKCFAEVVSTYDSSWELEQGKVLLYLELNEALPVYGDYIQINQKLISVPQSKNPYEFDYQRFLKYKNIELQAFVAAKNWSLVGKNKGNKVIKFSLLLARKVKNVLTHYMSNNEDRAILSALLLGNKSNLEPQLLNSFSKTGTLHILAVSGLHVGVIYLLLINVLAFIIPKKWEKLKLVLIIACLWMFALLTGLSPSVSRACFMLSIVAIGNSFERKISVYNTLAFSAFCLLLYNPMNLLQVGFQFSYLAVIGIVVLQKPIRNLISTSSWFFDKVLNLAAVSCAAQIATLPLALFYFGQFPVYFLLSNLIIVPLVGLIVYGSVLLLAVSWIPMLAEFVALILSAYLWFMKKVVGAISNLPYSQIDSIYINKLEVFVLVVAIILTSYYFIFKREKTYLYLTLTALIVIFGSQNMRRLKVQNTSEYFFIDFGKSSELFYRKGFMLQATNPEIAQTTSGLYSLKPLMTALGIMKVKPLETLSCSDSVLSQVKFKSVTIQIATKETERYLTQSPRRSNVLWIQELGTLKVQDLKIKSDLVYLDSRLSFYDKRKLKSWCLQNGVIVKEGYYSRTIAD